MAFSGHCLVSSVVSPLRPDEVATVLWMSRRPGAGRDRKLVRLASSFREDRLLTVRPKESRRLVDGSVLVDVAFGKVEQARNGFRARPRCREGGANLGTPMAFLSLKREVSTAGAVLASAALGGITVKRL